MSAVSLNNNNSDSSSLRYSSLKLLLTPLGMVAKDGDDPMQKGNNNCSRINRLSLVELHKRCRFFTRSGIGNLHVLHLRLRRGCLRRTSASKPKTEMSIKFCFLSERVSPGVCTSTGFDRAKIRYLFLPGRDPRWGGSRVLRRLPLRPNQSHCRSAISFEDPIEFHRLHPVL